MRRGILLVMLSLAADPATARTSVGVYGGWGAFTDTGPKRCFAIARPAQALGGQPFATIATWPSRGTRNQLHIRLSHIRDPRARVTLSVGERRFDLIASGSDAWARDTRTDSAIVSAMRSSRSMSVETLAQTGQPFADVYALHGAATAIDAASLACLQRDHS